MNLIDEKISMVVKKCSTKNPYEIAKHCKIIVRHLPLGKVLGFYMYDSRVQIITLNNSMDSHLEKFVMAHELGHAILHKNKNSPFLFKNTLFSKEETELQANYFAVKLLLWEKPLTSYKTEKHLMMDNGFPQETHEVIRFFFSKNRTGVLIQQENFIKCECI